jgi:Undecaprenyl-phosphate glucose phosphotransferase
MPSQAATRADFAFYETTAPSARRQPDFGHEGDQLSIDGADAKYPFSRPVSHPISLEVVQGLLRLYDACAVVGSAGLVVLAMNALGSPLPRAWLAIVASASLFFFLHMGVWGAYAPGWLNRQGRLVRHITWVWLSSAALIGGISLATEVVRVGRSGWLLLWVAAAAILLSTSRYLIGRAAKRWRTEGRLARNIAIVGTTTGTMHLLAHLDRCNAEDVRIDGVYLDVERDVPQYCMGYPIRGSVDDLIEHARRRRIDAVVLCPQPGTELRTRAVQERLRQIAVDIHIDCGGPGAEVAQSFTGVPDELCGMPVLTVERLPMRGWAALAKSIEDRVIAAIILTMIAPILAVIAVLIKLDSPGPVFFSQRRYGLNNAPIRIFKFRTLHAHANDNFAGKLVTRNDSRVTRLGGFLRRTSLDELPQFLNVLKGEMSIVGPRPHAAAAKAGGLLYDEAVAYYHARHRVKPGITGWAQINGWRGETSTVDQIKARVDHDLYYIDHWSVGFDLRIIAKTVLRGFTGNQAY